MITHRVGRRVTLLLKQNTATRWLGVVRTRSLGRQAHNWNGALRAALVALQLYLRFVHLGYLEFL